MSDFYLAEGRMYTDERKRIHVTISLLWSTVETKSNSSPPYFIPVVFAFKCEKSWSSSPEHQINLAIYVGVSAGYKRS